MMDWISETKNEYVNKYEYTKFIICDGQNKKKIYVWKNDKKKMCFEINGIIYGDTTAKPEKKYINISKIFGNIYGFPVQFTEKKIMNLMNTKMNEYEKINALMEEINKCKVLLKYYESIEINLSDKLIVISWKLGKFFYNNQICGLYDYDINFSSKKCKITKIFPKYIPKIKYLFIKKTNNPYIKLPCMKYFINQENYQKFKKLALSLRDKYDGDSTKNSKYIKKNNFFQFMIGNTMFFIPLKK